MLCLETGGLVRCWCWPSAGAAMVIVADTGTVVYFITSLLVFSSGLLYFHTSLSKATSIYAWNELFKVSTLEMWTCVLVNFRLSPVSTGAGGKLYFQEEYRTQGFIYSWIEHATCLCTSRNSKLQKLRDNKLSSWKSCRASTMYFLCHSSNVCHSHCHCNLWMAVCSWLLTDPV